MLNSILGSTLTLSGFLICTAASLVLGPATAGVAMYRSRCTQSFAITAAILPAVVQLVIMLVNGSVGVGVAVAGAFSLVRFRSVPGTAREIGVLFLAMAIGLATGMGYVALAALFFVVIAGMMLLLTALHFGERAAAERILRITIPEDLNYSNVFDDLFAQYTTSCKLISVKTTNMGSMFKLQYHLTLADPSAEKAFIDALRCRNGNLEISIARQEANTYEL